MGNTISNTALFRPTEPSYGEELENLIFIPELMDINVAKFWDNEDFEIFNKNENMKELKQKKFPALFFYYTKEEKTKHTIIYFHSNSSDLGQMYEELEMLHKHLHANILAFEYAGFGLCYLEGTANQYNINRRAMASYNFLRSINIKSKNILLFGRSIGTGAATKLAYNLKLLKHEIGGVILHSPYISIKSLVEDYVAYASYLIENIYDNFKNLQAVSNNDKSDTPLLIIHGNDDEIVPVSHSKYMMKNLQNKYKNASYPNDSYHNYYYVIDDLGIPIKTFLDTLSKSKYSECVDINIPKQFFNKAHLYTESKNAPPSGSPSKNGSDIKKTEKDIDIKKLKIPKNINEHISSNSNSKSTSRSNSNSISISRSPDKNEEKRRVLHNAPMKDTKNLTVTKDKIKTSDKDMYTKEVIPNEETIKKVSKEEKNYNSERKNQIQTENEKRKYDENKIHIKITKAKNEREQKIDISSIAINNSYSSIKKDSDRSSVSSVKGSSSKGSARNIDECSNDKDFELLTNEYLKKRKKDDDSCSRYSSKKSSQSSDIKTKNFDRASKSEQGREREEKKKTSETSKSENKGKNEQIPKEQVPNDKKRRSEFELKEKVKITNKTDISKTDKSIPMFRGHKDFFKKSSAPESKKKDLPVKNESKEVDNKKGKGKEKEKENVVTETFTLQKGKREEQEKIKLKERDREKERNKIKGEENTKLDKKKTKEAVKEREREKNIKKELMPTLQKEKKTKEGIVPNEKIETKQYRIIPEAKTYKITNIPTDQNERNETQNPKFSRNIIEDVPNELTIVNQKQNGYDSYKESENNNDSDKQFSQYDEAAANEEYSETHMESYINNNVTIAEEEKEEYVPYEEEESMQYEKDDDDINEISNIENDSINENSYDIKEFSYYVQNNIINKDKIKDFIDVVMDGVSEEDLEEEKGKEYDEYDDYDKCDGIETEQAKTKNHEPNTEEQKKNEPKETENDESTQNHKREDNMIE